MVVPKISSSSFVKRSESDQDDVNMVVPKISSRFVKQSNIAKRKAVIGPANQNPILFRMDGR